MKAEAERGYLILAQNNSTVDYIACAEALAMSIRLVEPDAKICLVTDKPFENPIFDYIRLFPFGDLAADHEWKLKNDWQCFYASPFRETIKLEADMIVPQNISHWFDVCSVKELVCTIGARDYYNQPAQSRHYRKIFDENNLPDVYNAITYWRLGAAAKEFFDAIREIFNNWDQIMTTLKFGTDQPLNTDLAYALALHILGKEKYTLPASVPSMIHMKSRIIGIGSDDWTRELVWEIAPGSVRINTIEQLWPVHYHIKSFAKTLKEQYGRIS